MAWPFPNTGAPVLPVGEGVSEGRERRAQEPDHSQGHRSSAAEMASWLHGSRISWDHEKGGPSTVLRVFSMSGFSKSAVVRW